MLFLYHDQLELLASLVGAANAIQVSDDNCARQLELFVALDVRPKGLSYPINLLRNIGSVAAATRRVVSLDADFVPSVNAAVDLALLPDTVGREDSPTACVLPVFQYVDGHKLPPSSNKEELLAMIVLDEATPMLQDHRSQHFTNYAAWWNATAPYSVMFGAFYEPYVMLNRGRQDPLFSELFLSSGNDKLSLHFELHAARYQYIVHPRHFLFHIPHSHRSGNWRHPPAMFDVAYRNLGLFLYELQVKYQYDFPYDQEVASTRVNSTSPLPNLVAPPLSSWVPPSLNSHSQLPPPSIKHTVENAFMLDSDMLKVPEIPPEIPPKIRSALELESGLNLNGSLPCGVSKDCVFMAPIGWSCNRACGVVGRICDAAQIAYYNDCALFSLKTVCPGSCFMDQGQDLPAVPVNGPQKHMCLTNKWQPTCRGKHPLTRRLCACS